MIDKMLLKHKTPSLDDVEECLLEWLGVDSKPVVENSHRINLLHFTVYLLILVHLQRNN